MIPDVDSSAGAAPPAPVTASTRDAPPSDLVRRLRLLAGVVALALLILIAAIGDTQLRRQAEYESLSLRQSHRRILAPEPRGVIYDREHRVLAGNKLHVAAVLHWAAVRAEFAAEERALRSTANDSANFSARARAAVTQRIVDKLNLLTGRSEILDTAKLERQFARDRITPFVLLDALTDEEARRIEASPPSSAVHIQRSQRRWYPHRELAAHVLGRVRRETIHQPAQPDFYSLAYVDAEGDSGLEKLHDAHLRGRPAQSVVRIDAHGFVVQPIEQIAGSSGRDLTLSIDLDLQAAAEEAMDATPGKPRGAAVAIAVATGEVLALASKPGFDLNAASFALSSSLKQQLDTDGAWLNRATQALYPPGSSFKIFTMLAGLRAGTLHPETIRRCDGFLEVGNRRFACHHHGGHGPLSLRTALPHSCNVFAYHAGLAAGPAALAAEARRFHFAEATGIDLPAETSRMLVPDPSWKSGDNRGAWTDGDTVNLAIGQGFLRISPLQAACAMASLARRETLTVPTLLHQPGRSPAGDRLPEPLDISDVHYAELVASLRSVVETGIGREAQIPGIKIAGKTGTAQIETPAGMKNVAWFIGFAPAENPEIALAVVMEGGSPNVESPAPSTRPPSPVKSSARTSTSAPFGDAKKFFVRYARPAATTV